MSDSLTKSESAELAERVQRIKRGLDSFLEVGADLLAIRDKRLYRATHKTFEAFARETFQISRRRAYQLIDAADVASNVNNCSQIQPSSESQIRPLTKLEPQQQSAAWEKAVESAGGETPTAKQVAAAVRQFDEPEEVHIHTAEEIKSEMVGGATCAPGSGELRVPTEAEATEGDGDSINLRSLKRYWRMAGKRDRRSFVIWVTNESPESFAE